MALVPQGLVITYVALIWATREIEIIFMFAGQMGCEGLNFVLKRIIKEERPKRESSSPGRVKEESLTKLIRSPTEMFGKGYGMPSSHAQFLAYFGVYSTLFLIARHRPYAQKSQLHKFFPRALIPPSNLQQSVVSLLFLILASLVAASRVYLSYHTPRQVLVGSSAGISAAVLWFGVTSFVRREGWIDFILDTNLAQAFRIRDLMLDQDLVESGWVKYRESRHARKVKEATTSKKRR